MCERADLRPGRVDLRPAWDYLMPERLDLRPERPVLKPKRPDWRLKTLDLRHEGSDLRGLIRGEGDGTTEFHRNLSTLGPQPKNVTTDSIVMKHTRQQHPSSIFHQFSMFKHIVS